MAFQKQELSFPSADRRSSVFARIGRMTGPSPNSFCKFARNNAEYIDRCENLRNLSAHGESYAVTTILGMGIQSQANEGSYYGYFQIKTGEKACCEDVYIPYEANKGTVSGIPLVLIGHSMGSMVARSYMTKYGDEAKCAIFMGTSGANKP